MILILYSEHDYYYFRTHAKITRVEMYSSFKILNCAFFLPISLSFSIESSDSRPTALYEATSYNGKSGLIVTAKPSQVYIKSKDQKESKYGSGELQDEYSEILNSDFKNPIKRGSMFAVIEDKFYKSKKGTKLEEVDVSLQRDNTNEIANESSYLHEIPDSVTESSNRNVIIIHRNENKELIDNVENPVSVASSFGPPEGPDYPLRPSIAPVLLKAAEERNPQPRRYDSHRERTRERSDFHHDRRKYGLEKNKPYFKSHKSQYDPFSFQTPPRTVKEPQIRDKNIYSNRLDSRLSLQVCKASENKIQLNLTFLGIKLFESYKSEGKI